MRRLLITIRYDGTDYHGWQVQPNGVTVQERIQDAVEKVFGARLDVTGCSRTDSGVHANMFCFHMDTELDIPCEKVPLALNTALPDDIAVLSCKEVDGDFHARYCAKGKRYVYRLYDSHLRDPFINRYSVQYKGKLNVEAMNEAAQSFVGKHDFSAFCASGSEVEDRVRTVYEMRVERIGNEVAVTVSADGFLYNMVRIMVGTLLEVSEGKLSAEDIKIALDTGKRELAGRTAAAKGLCLDRVFYDEELM